VKRDSIFFSALQRGGCGAAGSGFQATKAFFKAGGGTPPQLLAVPFWTGVHFASTTAATSPSDFFPRSFPEAGSFVFFYFTLLFLYDA